MVAGVPSQSIWAGTVYAGWYEVMPYVAIVEPGSAFLEWVATTQATDWGWLAVSSSPWWQVPASVLEHLAGQSPHVRVGNLLQWLQEQRPDLYTAFKPATLQHKVEYFSRWPDASPEALVDYLAAQSS